MNASASRPLRSVSRLNIVPQPVNSVSSPGNTQSDVGSLPPASTVARTRHPLAKADVSLLQSQPELDVMRRLMSWPRLVEGAAQAREPHRIAFFLYELAGDFHMLWNRGKDDAALRFLQSEDPAGTLARIALVASVAGVIRSGLDVLGVEPVEEMR